MIARIWHDHSLTIVLGLLGVGLTAAAFLFENDRWWDVVVGLGQGTLTGALIFALSGRFRERNKPEDPADE